MAVWLSSCGRQTDGRQEGGDTVRVLHTYVLVPRHHPLPQVLPEGTLIRTPIQRACVFTTVHCSLFTSLGVENRIVGVADLKYIKIPAIHQRVSAGEIVDCGNGLSPVVEKMMELKPEVILLSPFENSGGYGKVEELDVPLVECAEYMETSPLARAEWMRFYGMLLGEERQTDSLFAVVDSCYQSLKLRAQEAGKWYVPGGQSTIGQMIQDAGGRYPWAGDTHSGSLSLPFETVLERGAGSEVWLYRYSSDHTMSLQELLNEYTGYRQLSAFSRRQVYGCNVERSLFYEQTPFRPDYLLSDFIRICHPDLPNLPPLRYYELLQ